MTNNILGGKNNAKEDVFRLNDIGIQNKCRTFVY